MAELVQVVSNEQFTTVFYRDDSGELKSFVLDAVRHERFIRHVYEWWLPSGLDHIKDLEEGTKADELRT